MMQTWADWLDAIAADNPALMRQGLTASVLTRNLPFHRVGPISLAGLAAA